MLSWTPGFIKLHYSHRKVRWTPTLVTNGLTVPTAPFTRPKPVHRLEVSITLGPRVRQVTGSSPEASSSDVLLIMGPV